MSRLIGCEINSGCQIVWQYRFRCPSDMYRIHTELGIGEYHQINRLEDRLILARDELEKLEAQIKTLKEITIVNEDREFITMVEAFRNCIVTNPEQDRFIFEGDL
jgi:hypothetical protein